MNIDTSTKDIIVSPLDSNGTKGSFGSDDSLEYSNDDRSLANTGKGVDNDKQNDKILPPKYPLNSAIFNEQPDTLFTPQRKQSVVVDRLPGPLHLFSPGLSPIGHSNHSQYDADVLEEGDLVDEHKRLESRREGATHDASMSDSTDSLDALTSPYFTNDNREVVDENRPNYQFWRNKLFLNDLAVGATSESTEKQSLLFQAPQDALQQKPFIRSNSNSFDSDFNLTPRHSLVYPTTDALYERSAALSPKSADVSMDSDFHVSRQQSLVYPTTNALYERSTHHSANVSIDSDAYATKQSLVYPASNSSFAGDPRRLHSPKSADVSIDSDVYVTHQSLVYPTTSALYARSTRHSRADVSADSDVHIAQQSLIHAEQDEGTGHPSADDSVQSDISLVQQSYLRHPTRSVVDAGNSSFNLSKLSMLDRTSPTSDYDEDALGQSLHSISLLHGSPASSSAPKRINHFLFPPPHPGSGISPSSLRNPAGLRVPERHAAQVSRRLGPVSSSDTEYANSSSKRRLAEVRTGPQSGAAGPFWREAEDLAPSNTFSTTPVSALTTPNTKGSANVVHVHTEVSGDANNNDEVSVSPLAPPSPSSVSAGSPSAAAHHHFTPAPAGSSLVVGALYTLQIDGQGRPAFVPVVLNQQTNVASGITFTSPHLSDGASPELFRDSSAGRERDSQNYLTTDNRFSSPPSMKFSHQFLHTSERAEEFGLSGANSNHVDIDKVLDRALHRGSLSEEKTKRWDGDTRKRNSPSTASVYDLSAHRADHAHHPATPQRNVHHSIPATPHLGPSSSAKSPFRLAVGADGKEHLQLSTEYYKERLLMRSLTSVLNTP